ncbi:preprotein translocase subunit YajC [Streptomyces sp. RKND-216]|uniref:preprotein translocase subunit YajC n=1 Tax=Streptomyces sp. RKND-216 TaxID=2562581 RepID=UPI002490495A|nr:preprotein translocase subunit YajC [Streptomyces sp. RKND-216]
MNGLVTLLPFIVLIGVMFLMTRSAKRKQQQAAAMRDQMEPGTGVRTIGGLYATVKEVREDTVLLEVAPGQHSLFAKNAVGAVLEPEEYERIVHGGTSGDLKSGSAPVVPDDASELADAHEQAEDGKLDLGKDSGSKADEDAGTDARRDGDTDSK